MSSQMVVTLVGADRPGIVSRVTGIFLEHGGNLEESKMAVLGGEFAAIILVSGNAGKFPAMQRALEELQADGIVISTKITSPASADTDGQRERCEVLLRGADHEGIVHNLASHLRDRKINIQSAHTHLISAPVTGSPLFCMNAVIMVPGTISMDELKKDLDQIARQESVEIELRVGVEAEPGLTEAV